eukprot:7092436-Pyramimonas_sp.AAC.1
MTKYSDQVTSIGCALQVFTAEAESTELIQRHCKAILEMQGAVRPGSLDGLITKLLQAIETQHKWVIQDRTIATMQA